MELLIIIFIGIFIWLIANPKKNSNFNPPQKSEFITPEYENSLVTQFKKHREAQCHNCKSQLTSLKERECDKCDWLVCPNCGSCEYSCSGDELLLKSEMQNQNSVTAQNETKIDLTAELFPADKQSYDYRYYCCGDINNTGLTPKAPDAYPSFEPESYYGIYSEQWDKNC